MSAAVRPPKGWSVYRVDCALRAGLLHRPWRQVGAKCDDPRPGPHPTDPRHSAGSPNLMLAEVQEQSSPHLGREALLPKWLHMHASADNRPLS